MTSIPLSDLESSPSAKFANIGDSHAGRIIATRVRQQTDPVTKALKTFADGSPRMQWVISIQKADGDTVDLYASNGSYKAVEGSGEAMLRAIGIAVRAANATGVDIGGELAVAYTGNGERKPGLNAPKLYTAQYRPPAPQPASIPVDLFNS